MCHHVQQNKAYFLDVGLSQFTENLLYRYFYTMAKLSHSLKPSRYMGLEVLAQMSVAMQICTIFPRVPPKCKFTYLSHHAGQCP